MTRIERVLSDTSTPWVNSVRALLLLSGVALMANGVVASSVAAQEWRNLSLSRLLGSQESLDVRVRYGAGEFELGAVDNAELMYSMDLRYDEQQFEPVAEYGDGTLQVGIESIRRNINVGKRSQARMDLGLTRGIPLRLDIEVGAAEVDLDLTGLSVRELDFSTGASHTVVKVSEPNPVRLTTAQLAAGAAEFTARGLGNLNAAELSVDAGVGDVTLDFSGDWQGNTRAKIDMGLGALKLRFPRGLGVKLMKDSFLTSFDARGMEKRGDAYYSEGYDEAQYHMEVEVDAAFGAIEIIWIN